MRVGIDAGARLLIGWDLESTWRRVDKCKRYSHQSGPEMETTKIEKSLASLEILDSWQRTSGGMGNK